MFWNSQRNHHFSPATCKCAAANVLLALLLLALPADVQAQFTFTTNNDGTLTIAQYTGPGGDVTIPDTTNGLSVTIIGTNAFLYCRSLTNVTVPSSVTRIGEDAFALCTNLNGAYF